MSAAVLVPAGVSLRAEYNEVNPHRDTGSDGWIGDSAHTSSSDHTPDEDSAVLRDHDSDHKNEVHAVDIDSTGPWPDGQRATRVGSWFDRKIKSIVAREKRRWNDPHDVCRLEYVIWNGMIYSRIRNFEPVPYTGSSDPHTGHAHFSFRYLTTSESDTSPWGVAEGDDEMDAEGRKEIIVDLLNFDLGKKGGGDTVQVALQTAMQQSKRAADDAAGVRTEVAGLHAMMTDVLAVLTQIRDHLMREQQ